MIKEYNKELKGNHTNKLRGKNKIWKDLLYLKIVLMIKKMSKKKNNKRN